MPSSKDKEKQEIKNANCKYIWKRLQAKEKARYWLESSMEQPYQALREDQR